MMNSQQAELREFIRRLGTDDERLDQLDRRMAAAKQNLRGMAGDGNRGSVCLTTLTGRVIGNTSITPTILPGISTIEVFGHTSGINYGTFPTEPDGTFSIALSSIDAADGSPATLDFYVTGPTVRFGTSVVAQARNVTRCATTVVADIAAVAGTGFVYLPGRCNYPVKTTLNWTETLLGSGTIPTGGSTCFPYTTLATPTCPTPVNTNIEISIASLFYSLAWPRATVGGCPIVRACPVTSGSTGASALFPASLATIVCPDDVTSTLFSISWTHIVSDDPVLGSGTHTMTFFETLPL